MTTTTALCRLDEIAAPGSRGFSLGSGVERREIFVVRDAVGEARAYVNSCPHTGGPLDWVEHQFLSLDRRLILCATHGALFRIEDGHCVHGPCAGKRLTPLAIAIVDGAVMLLE
jgi:nitrite reductase/ring-hydroxylating ferredoxin subunit